MEDNFLSPGTMMHNSAEYAMDYDYMDELLSEGCWLDSIDGSELLRQIPSKSSAISDYSYLWPTLEPMSISGELNTSLYHEDNEEGRLIKSQSPSQNTIDVSGCSSQSETYTIGGSELGKRLWIGPRSNPGPSSSVMERLTRALGFIRGSAKDKDTLIQVWIPVVKGDKQVLITNDQPFSHDPNNPRLASYRNISLNYQFSAEKNSAESVGLPGRVFLGKVPEWTPDVRFFRSDEYPRVDYAQHYDVCGTLALPIFERDSRTCLGVIEVVTTYQKSNYGPELQSVCKALEAVDLSSSKDVRAHNTKACKESYQAALPEILEVLKSACVTHRLPLAQTWVSCSQQGREGCRHSDENYIHCVSTVDSACYVGDPQVRGFQEACSEHHLLKGQGVAGRAFTTNQPCFSQDISSFSKTEYPLSHHARMFGLRASVAIRFRSIHTGVSDFVLEFFLPANCKSPEEQKKTLSSLSIMLQKVCRSLRVVTDRELEEETTSPLSEVIVPPDCVPSRVETTMMLNTSSDKYLQEESSCTEVQQKGREPQKDSGWSDYCNANEGSFTIVGKAGEKRRSKAEKTITVQVLRQYFAGSLKDAAKNLGVCPTTLKRICRQQGITRWPSRKIKKVGHSLEKLQRVIDSVQGASGTIQIGSFYSNFPELASPKVTQIDDPISNMNPGNNSPKPLICPHPAPKSPSSSLTHSSSSSQSSKSTSSWNISSCEDAIRSDVERLVSSQKGSKFLTRSQTHVSFNEQHPIMSKTSDWTSREGDARRVKVTYGEEKIRFRMQNHWKFRDLLDEISKRFGIDEIGGEFHLKYLDDDSEWVLLTCHADLEECLDVCQSSQTDTIKLSLHTTDHQPVGSSLGSNSLL